MLIILGAAVLLVIAFALCVAIGAIFTRRHRRPRLPRDH